MSGSQTINVRIPPVQPLRGAGVTPRLYGTSSAHTAPTVIHRGYVVLRPGVRPRGN